MKFVITFIMSLLLLATSTTLWAKKRYGESLCQSPGYACHKVKKGQTWQTLFANAEQRDIVKRINRMNIRLRPGMTIAIPNNLINSTIYDHSPFPRYIDSTGEKTIYVSQKHLAWAAYDDSGELVWWGPVSSGTSYCGGAKGKCHTPSGAFRFLRKQGIDCVSSAFPRRANGMHGGAEMPFCMHFFRGYAVHGSYTVPGYRDSHGCVRIFIEDARWLNEEFIDLPSGELKGTRVIIGDLS